MIVVTGAGGSLGRAIAQRLVTAGKPVRGFVRKLPAQPIANVEYVVGDLSDPKSVDAAIAGAQFVMHAGATMTGDWEAHRRGTIVGTENVLATAANHGVEHVIHISSLSVIDWAGSTNAPVDESTRLEPHPDQRGFYTRAKLEAEQRVAAAKTSAVILRPGQIFGGGIPLLTGAVARHVAGRWVVLGDGKLELPLVYIDDVVDAVMIAMARVNLTAGKIIQLVDPEHLTQNEVLALAGVTKIVRVPRSVVFALGRVADLPLRNTAYRLKSALSPLHYQSKLAEKLLGWRPTVGVREGINRVRS